MSSHNDIMCEVEIDSSIVEVVDNEAFSDMGVVSYDHYEVRVGDDDQYEEVTCENDDSQGLLLQNIDDGMYTRILHFLFQMKDSVTIINLFIYLHCIRRSYFTFRI